MFRLRLALGITLLVVAGCAPLRPSTRTPDGARAAERPRDPVAGPWVVRDAGSRRAQVITVRAVISSEVEGRLRVDTLRSSLEFAWSAVPGSSPARLAGMVVAYTVAVGEDTAKVPPGVTLPFSFTADQRVDAAQPEFTIPDGGSCTSANAAAVHGVRDSWLSLPQTLERGTAWQDSSDFLICRDGIPLAVTAVRSFVATGARMRDGQLAVTVQRGTTLRLSGSGLQFGEPIEIQGDGEGTMTLEVALAGGVILRAEGLSELRLRMQGRRRQQTLVQSSRVEIREP